MIRSCRPRTLITVASVALAACSADAPPPEAETAAEPAEPPPFETTEVAPGVHQFRFGGHNTLFVRTGAGVVAFDPISVEAAAPYAEAIGRVAPGAELIAIVYSHRDADHATGARVLRAELASDAPAYAHRNAAAPLRAASDPELPPPDSTFTDRLSLAGGEVELHYFGRSHSDDMAVAYLPEHRLAFAVDFVSRDRLGYRDLSTFHFPDMFGAIEGLLGLPFERIVFGHGPAGDRASVERQLGYYRDLDAAVRAALADGLTEDETAAGVLLEAYRDWDRYDDWRELNVRGMYRKISAGM